MSQSGGTFGNLTLGVAGSDLSAEVYKAVVFSAGKIALAGAAAIPLGFLQNKPKADEACNTMSVEGMSTKAITNNSAIVVGSPVKCAASGKVALAAAEQAIGIALEPNGSVDGAIIEILIKNHTAA